MVDPVLRRSMVGALATGVAVGWAATKNPASAQDTPRRSPDAAFTTVVDLAALSATPVAPGHVTYLGQRGLEGFFAWREGDFRARVASDSHSLFYVSSTIKSPTDGAWKRIGDLDLQGASIVSERPMQLPRGKVICNGTLDLRSAKPDPKTSGLVQCLGALLRLADLARDVEAASTHLTFVSPHGLAPGDVINLFDPAPGSFSAARPVYHAGEWCKVARVMSPTAVEVDAPIWSAYRASSLQISRLDGWTGRLENLQILCPRDTSTVAHGLLINNAQDVSLINVRCSDAQYSGFMLRRVFGFYIRHCSVAEDGVVGAGVDYGLAIANSQRGLVEQSHFVAARHGITHGGGGGAGSVPVRDVHYRACTAASQPGSNPGFDIHGNAESITATDCVFPTGAVVGGRDITFQRCRFLDNSGSGYCYYATEVIGGRFVFDDCAFVLQRPETRASGRGVLDFVGSPGWEPLKWLRGPVQIVVRRSRFISSRPAPPFFIRLRNLSDRQPTDVVIDGLDIEGHAPIVLIDTIAVPGQIAARRVAVTGVRAFSASPTWQAYAGNGAPEPIALEIETAPNIFDHGNIRDVVLTLDSRAGAIQKVVCDGAVSLKAPTRPGQMLLELTNGPRIQRLSAVGFQVVTGDRLEADAGSTYLLAVVRVPSFAHLTITRIK